MKAKIDLINGGYRLKNPTQKNFDHLIEVLEGLAGASKEAVSRVVFDIELTYTAQANKRSEEATQVAINNLLTDLQEWPEALIWLAWDRWRKCGRKGGYMPNTSGELKSMVVKELDEWLFWRTKLQTVAANMGLAA